MHSCKDTHFAKGTAEHAANLHLGSSTMQHSHCRVAHHEQCLCRNASLSLLDLEISKGLALQQVSQEREW